MERLKFLERCRAFACLPKGIHREPVADASEVLCRYKGAAMWPNAYKLWFDEGTGKIRHTAVLVEKNANALWEVPLEEVEDYAD